MSAIIKFTKSKWDSEKIMTLIEEYRKYECLWLPSDKKYKCRNSKEDAWEEIGKVIEADVAEIKRKMKNLIAQFYRERKKRAAMKKSGAGAHFVSKWFAYNALLFLRDKNKVRKYRERGVDKNEVSL